MTNPAYQPALPNTSARDDELDLIAFRYVAGELTADEAATFEERLAVEQVAREAVARAVEIVQSVSILGPQAVLLRQSVVQTAGIADTRRPRRSALTLVLLAAAAGVALVIALDPFDAAGPGGAASADRPASAARLVELWSDAGDVLTAEPGALESANFAWSDEASNGESGDSDFAWVLAAVSAELPMPDSTAPAPALPNPLTPETREN